MIIEKEKYSSHSLSFILFHSYLLIFNFILISIWLQMEIQKKINIQIT